MSAGDVKANFSHVLLQPIPDILMQVHHPHIVSMHDMYESKDAVYIVTDLCEGGELFQQLLERGTYTEKDASNIVRQMLEGLAYLHEHDVSIDCTNNSSQSWYVAI